MDGIIIINKSKGCTSHDIVYKAKKLFNEKVGHTGTLDPNATGVLPLLIGKGTLVSQFLINHDKVYDATLKLGIKTDTADGEGKVLENCDIPSNCFSKTNVENALKGFVGKQLQKPPMYSAIKVNGKKLYDYARNNETVDVKLREIEIYDLKLFNVDMLNNEISFRVHCSKGTYIRTLCEDIACKLGTVGFMKELNRRQVGQFSIDDAVDIDSLEQHINDDAFFARYFISIEKLFENCSYTKLDDDKLRLFLNGVKLTTNEFRLFDENLSNQFAGCIRVYDSLSHFVGIGISYNGFLKREIVICPGL